MNKHWFSFAISVAFLLLFVVKSTSYQNWVLPLVLLVVILVSTLKKKNNLGSSIGFYAILAATLAAVIGYLDSAGFFGVGEFRGLTEFVIAEISAALAFVSYLVSIFLKK